MDSGRTSLPFAGPISLKAREDRSCRKERRGSRQVMHGWWRSFRWIKARVGNRAFRCLINVTGINSVSGRRALDDQRIIGPVRLEGPPPLSSDWPAEIQFRTLAQLKISDLGIAQSLETLETRRKSEIWGLSTRARDYFGRHCRSRSPTLLPRFF